LLKDSALGGLALLRNLRNMEQEGVERELIHEAIRSNSFARVLPFRFIAAAKHAMSLEPVLEEAFLRVAGEMPKWPGRTMVLVDVSGSMDHPLSLKSDMNRIDAACGLAAILCEACDDVDIFTFSNEVVQVPARRGFALCDAIRNSQPHGATHLGEALKAVDKPEYTRRIVITDEQTYDIPPAPKGRGWIINVASNKRGIANKQWTHIDGWSEAVVRYMMETEMLA
jgi:hypothetical protein